MSYYRNHAQIQHQKVQMPTIALLFNGDQLKVSDADLITRTIFDAVLRTAPESRFQLRSGGVLLSRFSYRTTAVHRSKIGKHTALGYTQSDDKELRKTLAVTFAASVAAQYHRIDADELSYLLLIHNIECFTISDIPLSCSDHIHSEFQAKCSASYFGCFEVDKGDPLVLELAANGLIPFCEYSNQVLRWLISFDENPADYNLEWAKDITFKAIEFITEHPDDIPEEKLSESGAKSMRLSETRGRKLHGERVLSKLYEQLESRRDEPDEFKIEFKERELGKPYADVRKLRDYCLNEEHTNPDGTPGKGRAKAYLFRRLLGITRDDWRFLGEQLVTGLEKQLIGRPVADKWGVKYESTIPVTGLNGVTKLVTSGWIIRPNEPPSLASAYITKDAESEAPSILSELIVPRNLKGDDFWKCLYDLAAEHGKKAAEECIPTPMWIEGLAAPIADGALGYAWVELPDGRSSFSRWLRKTDTISKYVRGRQIWCIHPSQSVERARKYCEAFAQVLRLNGIECKVEWRYD
jgi:hypothetical protein